MTKMRNKSKIGCLTVIVKWTCGVFLGVFALLVVYICVLKIASSDFFVWNFTNSKDNVYKYVVKSREKFKVKIVGFSLLIDDFDYGSVQERLDYLYTHNDSLVFDSLLSEILRFRTKEGCLKDFKTLCPVLDWCKERGKKYSEIILLKDSFLSLNRDTIWSADLYNTKEYRINSINPFLSHINEVVCYMVADSFAWKGNEDVYNDVTTCNMIRSHLFEQLVQNGHCTTDSSSIPERVKLHQCLFSWDSWSGFELNLGKGILGYVLQNDTVCEIISLYGKRHDTIDRYSYSIIDRYYYGDIKQEDCDCNHFWHDRMVSKVEIENPSDCFHMRDSIFSNITSSLNVTYHQKRISHFE